MEIRLPRGIEKKKLWFKGQLDYSEENPFICLRASIKLWRNRWNSEVGGDNKHHCLHYLFILIAEMGTKFRHTAWSVASVSFRTLAQLQEYPQGDFHTQICLSSSHPSKVTPTQHTLEHT